MILDDVDLVGHERGADMGRMVDDMPTGIAPRPTAPTFVDGTGSFGRTQGKGGSGPPQKSSGQI